jgi:hypothetical protein
MSINKDNTLLSAINALHTPRSSTDTGRTASTSVPRNSSTSSSKKSGRFSFRNLFPDLRTEAMIVNENKRMEAARARGKREQSAYEQAVEKGASEQVLRMFAEHPRENMRPKLHI